MSYAEIKKAINSDLINEPLNVKTDRIEADTQDIQTKVNAIFTPTGKTQSITKVTSGSISYTTVKSVTGSGYFSLSTLAVSISGDNSNSLTVKLTVDGTVVFEDILGLVVRTAISTFTESTESATLVMRYDTSLLIEHKVATTTSAPSLATIVYDLAD